MNAKITGVSIEHLKPGILIVTVKRGTPNGGDWNSKQYTAYDWQIERNGRKPGRLMRLGLALLAMSAKRDMGVDILRGA